MTWLRIFSTIVTIFFLTACNGNDASDENKDGQKTALTQSIDQDTVADASTDATQSVTFSDDWEPNWVIDESSRLEFIGTLDRKQFGGAFENFEAKILFDAANPSAGNIDVIVQTASARTGDAGRDNTMPGPEWFDVKQFPTARFRSTTIRATGENQFEIDGQLTIRDMTQSLTLPFTLQETADSARAEGEIVLIRTDYGLGQGAWASGNRVALDVKVRYIINAKRQ